MDFARSAFGVRCVLASLWAKSLQGDGRPVIEDLNARKLAARAATLLHA
jgi:hypothetical protein